MSTIPARPLPQMLSAFPEFSDFLGALKRTGVDKEIAGTGPFTVFVPSNGAFAAIPKPERDRMLSDVNTLRSILRHHIVRGRVDAVTLILGAKLPGSDGTVIDVRNELTEPVTVDGAPLVGTNIVATNGLIHVISGVIYPKQ